MNKYKKYRIVQEGENTFFVEDRLFIWPIPIWFRTDHRVFSTLDEAKNCVKSTVEKESFKPKIIKYNKL